MRGNKSQLVNRNNRSSSIWVLTI